MRLSEARIKKLAKEMARQLAMRGAVKAPTPDPIALAIGRALTLDQKAESDIEAEARDLLARQRSLPPPGTGEYQAAFVQAKRAIAHRKGFIL